MAYQFYNSKSPYNLPDNYGNFVGYRIALSRLGAPTKPDTANQIAQVAGMLNQGIKQIEVGTLSPDVFDQIPKQHFKEMNRLVKLTGAETSVHAPLIEPSGFVKEGAWNELDRKSAERHMFEVIDKAHELSPDKNVPVTFHGSGIPGTEWMPGKKGGVEAEQMIAINKETGEMRPLKSEEMTYPGRETRTYTPEERLKILNESHWDNNLSQVVFYKDRGTQVFNQYYPTVAANPYYRQFVEGKMKPEEFEEKIKDDREFKSAFNATQNAQVFLDNSRMMLNSLYNEAYKVADEDEKKKLKEFGAQFAKDLRNPKNPADVFAATENLINNLRTITPKSYEPIEDFAISKASKTFANTAFHGYNKFGDKAPIVSIENLYPGMTFSRGEQMKQLVEESRKKFVEKAVKEGRSESEAENAAKKLIGVTWDVGHLNIMKKAGFKNEDVIKETEAIAKYVKHVHLTDNFGHSDSHLPIGMGNVPAKEIMEKLEQSGFKGKTAVEAGGWAQHFGTSPFPDIISNFGSPIYSDGKNYWNQASWHVGGYMGSYNPWFPEQHFSIYGAGFSGLPSELGGQFAGRQSRFSGTPEA
jgi:sugar phosphate isomerase/epimerase